MNALKKITGTWKGTYSYQPVEHIANLDPMAFTLTLKQGWFGRFKGTVTDDGLGGMPGTGFIEGHFSFPFIECTKQMPICHVAMPNGRSITMREYLNKQGHACAHDIPHPPIFYKGEFFSPIWAHGTWIIRAGPIFLGDGRVVQVPEAKGNWSIETA